MLFEKFYDAGAGVYDQNFGRVSREFVPRLLEAARVAPGQRVLDIATGTGIAAEIAAEAVGPSGHVVAADISRPMLDRARERLSGLANTSVSLEDGQALTLPDRSFDAVLCNLGLMLFSDPARGLSEFRRVLREGGRAAVSVNTTPERSFAARINIAIGRHVPSRAAAAAHYFALGDPAHLRGLFEAAGFREVEIASEATLRFLLLRRLLRALRVRLGGDRDGIRRAPGGRAPRRPGGCPARTGGRRRAGRPRRGAGGNPVRQRP